MSTTCVLEWSKIMGQGSQGCFLPQPSAYWRCLGLCSVHRPLPQLAGTFWNACSRHGADVSHCPKIRLYVKLVDVVQRLLPLSVASPSLCLCLGKGKMYEAFASIACMPTQCPKIITLIWYGVVVLLALDSLSIDLVSMLHVDV